MTNTRPRGLRIWYNILFDSVSQRQSVLGLRDFQHLPVAGASTMDVGTQVEMTMLQIELASPAGDDPACK
jgi:hypothetical protein